MSLTKENITRELLEKAAADLNKTILDEESVISIDGVMEDALQADVLEVGEMLVETDIPELKAKTKEVLAAMGIELFVEKEEKEEVVVEESEKEKVAKKPEKEVKVTKETIKTKNQKPEKNEKETKNQKSKKRGIGTFVCSGLKDGSFENMTNKEIAELAVKKFNGNTKAICIAWYKGKLKKQGIKMA